MSFVAAATTVGATVLGTGAAAGIGSTIVGGALIGAGIGGAYSAITGDGKILDSMLTGAGIGGLAGGIGGAFFPGAAGYAAPTTAAVSSTPAVGAYANPGISTSKQVADFANASSDPIGALYESGALSGGAGQTATTAAKGLTAKEMLGYGLGATTLMGLLGGQQQGGVSAPGDKGNIRPFEYSSTRRDPETGQSYYFEPIQYDQYGKATAPLDTSERNYFNQKFTPLPTYKAALGGQVPQLTNMPPGGLAAIESMRDGYGPTQTMAGNIPQFSMGGMPEGNLGGYSDGGRLLRGPGDGVSDDIPATINDKQPARLADGEFVIPARIVSEIGNGSTDAGAKRLYAMMDKIQAGRKKTVGKGKVAVDTKAKKHLLA